MPPFRVTRASGIPLVGSLYFGIIDRGTNLLQVRPNCSCNINCPFCSVDAGGTGSSATSNCRANHSCTGRSPSSLRI